MTTSELTVKSRHTKIYRTESSFNRVPKYYVYALVSPTTGEPFYIGKGQRDRAESHLERSLKHLALPLKAIKKNGVNPHLHFTLLEIVKNGGKPIIERIAETNDEDYAFFLEIYLIDFWRRNGKSRLCNIAPGGRGPKRPAKKRRVFLPEEIADYHAKQLT
jgi:hypothetical protein